MYKRQGLNDAVGNAHRGPRSDAVRRFNENADIGAGAVFFRRVRNLSLIHISGIWEVSYDANDRPIVFTSQDGRTAINCGYDYRGRRFEKKVFVNGACLLYTSITR